MSDEWPTLQWYTVILHPFLTNNLILALERSQECKAQHAHILWLIKDSSARTVLLKNPDLFDMKP